MVFRTEFPIPVSDWKLELNSEVISIGSCFAEVVGERLREQKIKGLVQPFGTLFSPFALFRTLELALEQEPLDERLFLETSKGWVHYDFHSSISGLTREELTELVENQLSTVRKALQQADVLIITFGSAWAYELNESSVYVANCHKQPARLFTRELLSVKAICKEFARLYKQLKAANPKLRILLTVSPVRHARDGMAENAISKSVLRLVAHYLVTDFADVDYFPAYELLLDDLRDYRFYATDLVHPSAMAEQYIFEKFQQTYFSKELLQFSKDWEKISKALQHRPFQENSVEHKKFLEKLHTDLENLPVDVSAEMQQIRDRLARIQMPS